MRDSLIIRIIEYLKRHLQKKRWRRTATCLAALVVFCITYMLMLPAISMTKNCITLSADTLTAWSGDRLSVRVTAYTEEQDDTKIFVLTTEGEHADLSEEYSFNEEGVCVITDEDGKEIELHRAVRGRKKGASGENFATDYWFALEAGEKTAFTLVLSDEVDEGRFYQAVETIKSIAGVPSDAAGSETATASDARRTATASDASKKPETKEGPGTATASDALRAARLSDSTASLSDALKEEDEDGFVQLADGEILNDLEEEENEEQTETVAFLKLSAGSGKDYEDAVKDAEKNADKRENTQLKFTWKDIAEQPYITPEMFWSGNGAQVAVIFDGDAMLPADAVLSVEEIEPGTAEYDAYLAQAADAVRASGSDASKEMGVDYARFFDICILDGDGNELEPAAPVKVLITYDEAVSVENGGDLNVMHFHEENGPAVLDAEKADTALSFTAEKFSVFGVVRSTIEKLVLADDGRTYRVTVTCGADAAVPEGAELRVSEITEQSAGYQTYVEETAAAVGAKKTDLSYIKLLDISIVDENGREISPDAPVDVQIHLLDKEEADSWKKNKDELKVVHFGSSPETLDSTADRDIVSFRTEGFSVYAIAELSGPQELNGAEFGLMNTSGGTKPKGTALTPDATSDGKGLKGQTLTVKVEPVRRKDNVYVANNSGITMWTFHKLEGENTKYYITTSVGEALKYLKISTTGVSLADTPDTDCVITVTQGTNTYAGKYKFTSANGSLQLNNSNNFVRAAVNKNDSSVWMDLAELSNLNDDDFVVYTAEKVSVSGKAGSDGTIDYDVKNGDKIVLYIRVWNDDLKKYEHYAVDHDGSLVLAYEAGNTISWVGSKVNTMLWDFTEYYYEGTTTPNYYYELQNEYSGKYIAPQLSGDGFLSDTKIGINLNGRRYNRYYSTILAWDTPFYDYASMTVPDGEEGEEYRLVTAPMTKAWDFYFAKMTVSESSELTEVSTVDNDDFGIQVKMQDYPYQGYYIGGGYRSETQTSILGRNSEITSGNRAYTNLLKKNLGSDGYPVTTDTAEAAGGQKDVSLSVLFDGEDSITVNHQFLTGTYNETGYFEYDSTRNFAHLISKANDPWIGKPYPGGGGTYQIGDFVIYDQLGTSDLSSKDTLKHGQFLPYNDLDPNYNNGTGASKNNPTNETDLYGNPLSSLDPRKGEKLYGISARFPGASGTNTGDVDYFFGMELSAKFMQSESGVDAWGHDLIFEFSGDDDFWLYVDDMLVLDLGGVHSAIDGKVNFRTGKVEYSVSATEHGKTDLRTLYRAAYVEKNGEEGVDDWLDTIFKPGTSVFQDYSGHTMKMFYMERGSQASNLHMRFNLAPYVDGEVQLEKEVTGSETIDEEFPFQIWYEKETPQGLQYVLWGSTEEEQNKVTDTQTGDQARYQASYTVDGVTYGHVFFLIAGQTVSIRLPSEDTRYYLKECALDTTVFDEVTANEVSVAGENVPGAVNRKDYQIIDSPVSGRKKVIFDNHVNQEALKTLTVTKRLWRDRTMTAEIPYGTGEGGDSTKFKFRIYIGKGTDKYVGETGYAVYNAGKYHVKNPGGEYCIYHNGGFVSTGKTVYADLDTTVLPGEWKSEQQKATFNASPNGAVEGIPAGYSLEIPDLLNGTIFYVEERDDEIPEGYSRLGYTLTEGKYTSENQGTETSAGEISDDMSNMTVSIHNQHGWGLTVKKVWSDADFMEDHDEIYYAVYLKGDNESLSLLQHSVRQLGRKEKSITWFFSELKEGKNLNDYMVYEVRLNVPDNCVLESVETDPASGEVTGYTIREGNTTYDRTIVEGNIIRIGEGGTLTAGGNSGEHGYSANLEYTVSYSREELVPDQEGNYADNRTDTVTNSRSGIKLVKTDMAWNPLQGAMFTLKNSTGSLEKTFTSGEDGLIAVAYLTAGEEYTLTETASAYGYLSLIDSVTIKVGSADGTDVTTLYVNGSDEYDPDGPYKITQEPEPTLESMPTVTIRNKPFTLQAVKLDAVGGHAMEGVVFELYKDIEESTTGLPMPDYYPLEGYDNLETDEHGIIPKIVIKSTAHPDGLEAGTYYLKEKKTPLGYNPLGILVRMTISPTGQVTLEKAIRPVQTGSWTIEPFAADEDIAEVEFLEGTGDNVSVMKIKIKNVPKDPVRIRKLAFGKDDHYLAGVGFKLYQDTQIGEDGRPKEGAQPLIEGTTDEHGILNLGGLEEENTAYYLYETSTLTGYVLLTHPVIITTTGPNTVNASLDGSPLECTLVKDEQGKDIWEIKVYNSTGAALPATGGPGTRIFTILGGLLTAGAGVLLLFRRKRHQFI